MAVSSVISQMVAAATLQVLAASSRLQTSAVWVSGTKDKRGAEGWQAQIWQACVGCCGLHQCWQILPLAGLDSY